jgi:carboxyl-terminal processing protease
MLNRFSASASEIAAAALQDYGRAVIVGDVSTHGKGTVQKLEPLQPFVWPASATATNNPGTLKITRGKFYRVSGASTQLKGVASDIILPDVLNHSTLIGEGALDNALKWDTIRPVEYGKLNLVGPFLAELQRRSQERVTTNQEFIYIKQDIEQFKKSQADKTASLNERENIKDRERATLQNHLRDRERDTRPLPRVKIYELTVKNSAEPGLPAPKSFFVTNDVTILANTNWGPSIVSYSFTNSYTGEFTNFFAKDSDLTNGSSLGSVTNKIIKSTISKSVPQDPTLEEGERILADYISLLSKDGILTASH